MADIPKTFQNRVLQSLSPKALDRLDLQPVYLPVRRQIENIGQPIRNLYFLESGIASMTATFGDGSQVEVGLFGFEGVVGVSALMGTRRSLNSIYMQADGFGYRCSLPAGAQEFQRGEKFQEVCLRYVQAQLIQTSQSAGCNARHTIQQRLARWLLLSADRLRSSRIGLSQEFLGHMLGVRRSGVTEAVKELVATGCISTERGAIHIEDQEGLEKHACECYRTVLDYLNNYAEYDSGQREKWRDDEHGKKNDLPEKK